ncbi:MAG TPA: hypothetical protein VF064_19680 [Pyrinomonadaceae bacterium]
MNIFVTRPLILLLLAAVSVAAGASQAAAQVLPPLPPQLTQRQQTPQQAAAAKDDGSADDNDDDDDDADNATQTRASDPAGLLRTARSVYVRSNTVFVKAAEVEDSLRKRKEFRAWGMTVTRNLADADLVIEIERKSLTRRFTFTVLDPHTLAVLTSGKTRSVLFGKKIHNKVAEKFANRVKTVRPYPPVSSNP